jgi:hypothetical protein
MLVLLQDSGEYISIGFLLGLGVNGKPSPKTKITHMGVGDAQCFWMSTLRSIGPDLLLK